MPCISKPYLQVQNEHQAVAREHEGCPSVARNDFEMRIGTEPCQEHGLGSWKHGSRPKSMTGVKFREVSMRGTVTAREVASKDVQHYCGNTTADSGKFVGNGTCNASCVFAYTLLLHVAKSLATRTLYRKTDQAEGQTCLFTVLKPGRRQGLRRAKLCQALQFLQRPAKAL